MAPNLLVGALDSVVVGGGFYGCVLATELARAGREVTLLERDPAILGQASFSNQARVHGGYHYPRSLQTAARCQANYARFVRDYAEAVDTTGQSVYAIARRGSRVSASQFRRFCEVIGAPLAPIGGPTEIDFDPSLVEEGYVVREATFHAGRIAAKLATELADQPIDVRVSHHVESVESASHDQIRLVVEDRRGPEPVALELLARHVYVCAYAGTSGILERSGLDPLPLTRQDTEMALVRLPAKWAAVAITVMDGPFFSLVPFPPRPGLHTLSHVRFTPRRRPTAERLESAAEQDSPVMTASAFPYMITDARRYVPALGEAKYEGSITAVKVFPLADARTDGRPILVHRVPEAPGIHVIVGGKIDNVYDMIDELRLGEHARSSS
jgi:glycine/D-amino acid oxidase-like deaminating enzyme